MTPGNRTALIWRIGIVLAGAFGLTFNSSSLTYYTVQSNVIVLAYFGCAVYWMLKRGTLGAPLLRGAVTFWIAVTGLVAHILLNHGANPLPGLVHGTDVLGDWSIFAVHYIVPVMVFVDWLAFGPHRVSPWRHLPLWLLYPFGYAVVALFRAAVYPSFPNRYPYYFLDAATHGYAWVAGQFVVLIVEFAVLAAVILGLDRLVGRLVGQRPAPGEEPAEALTVP